MSAGFEWIERGPLPLSKTGNAQRFMIIAELTKHGKPLPADVVGKRFPWISRIFFDLGPSDIDKARKEIERDKPFVESRFAAA